MVDSYERLPCPELKQRRRVPLLACPAVDAGRRFALLASQQWHT
jgi:hypothetical protein